jgi:hypothetical protein
VIEKGNGFRKILNQRLQRDWRDEAGPWKGPNQNLNFDRINRIFRIIVLTLFGKKCEKTIPSSL